ncbi:tetratricopeptide repeat protein [uncultured Brachyspira sp.]|uniref:tetratricopeptide repeat protein n=1 Tax=uncultured Brachyspira sp. TaxID=221953 RepID=UPI00263055CB|nr:tetratricopeptide repeat protein [uncultured Brachyspira sp.]
MKKIIIILFIFTSISFSYENYDKVDRYLKEYSKELSLITDNIWSYHRVIYAQKNEVIPIYNAAFVKLTNQNGKIRLYMIKFCANENHLVDETDDYVYDKKNINEFYYQVYIATDIEYQTTFDIEFTSMYKITKDNRYLSKAVRSGNGANILNKLPLISDGQKNESFNMELGHAYVNEKIRHLSVGSSTYYVDYEFEDFDLLNDIIYNGAFNSMARPSKAFLNNRKNLLIRNREVIKKEIEDFERKEKEEAKRKEMEKINQAKEKENLAEKYYNEGNYYEAINLLNEAIKLNTYSEKSYFLLGKSHLARKEYEAAADNFYQVLSYNKNDITTWYLFGKTYFEAEDYSRSLNALYKVEELDPKNKENLFMIAAANYNYGYRDEAIEYFKKYIELDNKNDIVWYWLGKSYEGIKNNEEAENAYLSGLKINPENSDILYALGELNKSTGNVQEAKKYYEKALEANPNNDSSKNKLELINRAENIQKLNRSLNTAKIFKTTGIVLMVGGALTTASPFVIQYVNTKNINSINFDFLNSSKTDKDSKLQRTLFYTGVGVFGAGLITTIISSFAINNLERQISYAFVPIFNKNEYGIMDYGYAFNFSYKF